MTIQSKMKSLPSRKHFPRSTGPSRVGNSHANSRNWAKRTCHPNDGISLWGPQEHITLMSIVETGPKLNLSDILCMLSASLMIQSEMKPDNIFPIKCLWKPENSRIWSKIKLVPDFTQTFIISKFDEDPIKNKVTRMTIFSPLYVYGTFRLPWKPKFWPDLLQNLLQPIPQPNDGTCEIWSRLAKVIIAWECGWWTDDGHWMMDQALTISTLVS